MAEVTVSQLVKEGLAAGLHPFEIRKKLQEVGIRWRYGWSAHVEGNRKGHPGGARERARRLKAMPYRERDSSYCKELIDDPQQDLDGQVCGQFIEEDATIRMCSDCLARKWSE